jgi:D-alanine transaminase
MIGIYNGVVDNIDNIKVSPMSRAYTFGDAIYGVIPYANGFIHFKQHITRFMQSLKNLNIQLDRKIVEEYIAKLPVKDTGYVYYQVSKGIDKVRSHIWEGGEPERFGFFAEHDLQPKSPKTLMILEDNRWTRCDIKTTGRPGNILGLETAMAKGYDDVLFKKDGYILESSASNIFFVEDDTVYTPILSNNILEGITRMEAFNLCYQNDIEIKESHYRVEDILSADAVFLTSSISGITKISCIDDTQFSTDNSIVDKLQQDYFKNNLNFVI